MEIPTTRFLAIIVASNIRLLLREANEKGILKDQIVTVLKDGPEGYVLIYQTL